jgi:hypothetical protein
MVALPSVVQDLTAHGVEDILLICVARAERDTEPLLVVLELVVRPEGVVKHEFAILSGVADV